MKKTQTVISREVKRYMEKTGTTQADIGSLLNVTQTHISRRLTGRTHWSIDDLDALTTAGIVSPLWEGDEERRGMEK